MVPVICQLLVVEFFPARVETRFIFRVVTMQSLEGELRRGGLSRWTILVA